MKLISQSAVLATFLFSATLNASPVNINTASASDIAKSLSGIGMSKAQQVVKYRQKNGNFQNAADIVLVKGIGSSTYEKNKADILIK
ncbi:MAG: helix-hairpin-helix domain-containing protein [Gammaproteobacteria bacterium]|jgi:competence protein ComEA|nr:helix-hairpin-helix domain-containing protein [Gammaproteobacteria bacterium]MBT3726098.1 helix-hairpin-helix domain-containing protein [Gammaproteobacteria bacterium]MBT4077409.1 helix-hairpin-helix domain-containing protein [Gammaproteobacteria bacterium]MBT4196711.1 helix-hairpin-helix domain-containing protein [Gammaproteobacteria bacterium]MBT4448333.1 helix-hairpin-helix domain-containing protein [Gammaproteobacteria bacterium]